MTTQNESLIQKNQSLSQWFDFTGDIDTFCPDESQPVEVTEQNKPTEGSKKRKKRISSKSKSNVRNDVISPLAARGVEIKRNVAKRSQASSLPQRKLDIDKELDSWKMEEDSE